VKSLKDPRVKFESSSFQEVMLELFSLLKNKNTIDLLNFVVAELMNEQDQAKNK
jgi:predicted CopG family antitoxin